MSNGERRRRRAPSKTPWDAVPEDDLTPAQALVTACHGDIYRHRHAPTSLEGEADFFNAYERTECPLCGSGAIVRRGRDSRGLQRWMCKACGPSFTSATGTIFEGRKVPAADWTELLVEPLSFDSRRGIARSDRRADTTVPYWVAKVFSVTKDVQADTVLAGRVQIDEKHYPVADADKARNGDGSKLRGFSRNHLCMAVGCSGEGSFFGCMGRGKPSKARAWDACGGHIEKGSTLVHDKERSHSVLVENLGLASEAHDAGAPKKLPDRDNPLRDANRLCYLLELFLNSHSGFDRDDIKGWLDVFWVMTNPPDDRMEKAAMVLDREMRCAKNAAISPILFKEHGVRGMTDHISISTLQSGIYCQNS